ncbi:hypothetical protein CHS0354_028866 [Potamilus streckersoni]|uniref:Uncharacterized protein n=1 Tax=Potamilus streckersoni TaxID=2493646 RepID=A0AAE0VH81_9BIVA|nr:hypothetical protein CHS0354_028866 [Potamilus streckersoni]
MTSTITFLLTASVLTFSVQGSYYYDSDFAANVIAAVKLALNKIAQDTNADMLLVIQNNRD